MIKKVATILQHTVLSYKLSKQNISYIRWCNGCIRPRELLQIVSFNPFMVFEFAPRSLVCNLQQWAETQQIIRKLMSNRLSAVGGRQSFRMKWSLNPSCVYKALLNNFIVWLKVSKISHQHCHIFRFSAMRVVENVFSITLLWLMPFVIDILTSETNCVTGNVCSSSRKSQFSDPWLTDVLGCSLSNEAHHLSIAMARMSHMQTVRSCNYQKLIAAKELVRQWFRSTI